jgi:hypothetical protein
MKGKSTKVIKSPTFSKWYDGNLADPGQPFVTDGRILIDTTAIKRKAALRVLLKRSHVITRQRPDQVACQTAFATALKTMPRRIAFLSTLERDAGDAGVCVQLHSSANYDGPSVESWFNRTALYWLLDNIPHTSLELNRCGALLVFQNLVAVALLMPVQMPPVWVEKLAQLAKV